MATSLYKFVLSCSKVVGGGYKAVLSYSKVVEGGYEFVQARIIL